MAVGVSNPPITGGDAPRAFGEATVGGTGASLLENRTTRVCRFGSGCVMLDSLSVTINLGDAAFPGALSAGSLQLYAPAPSDQLATPEALTWTFGTRILFVSADKTAGGEPREVTLEDRDGRQVMFRFENGSAWAYPQGKFRDTSRRLFMVDANGVAVTNNPAWYDLSYGNGNSDRFPAQPDASGIRPLAAVYVAGGRWLTLASSGLDVVWDTANALRQIKTASALADIVTETGRRYRIDFYAVADVQKNGNLYVPIGTPKVTWTIENPSATSVDRLTITRTTGGSAKVYDARYTPYFGRWVVTAPGDLRKEESYSFWDASETVREEHRKVLSPAGQAVRHSIKKWQKFAWDQAVVAEVNDPDGAAMTTTNTYYTNPAEAGRYARLKTVLNADGSWVRYDYDGTGRTIEEVRPFGDSPPTAANAQARVTTYSYAPVDANDTPALGDQRPRTIVETALGREVSRTYHAYALIGGEQVGIVEQCAQPGAAYGAASNRRTVSRHYAATNPVVSAGLLRQVEHPDGTTASYDYAFGTCNAAEPSFTAGAGDAYRVMVTDGTTDHPEGIANKTTRKTAVYDSRGFNALSETWAFAGGTNYARIAWTARAFDAFGHATNVLYSNGLREEAAWNDCCGKSSDIAADGVRRDYAYDELGRLSILDKTTGTGTNLLEVYGYDAAGVRLSTTRYGGNLSLTSSNRYDTAGRILASADPAGLVTTYQYPDPLASVTLSPGGLLTNTTVRYPDGQTRYTDQNGIRQQTYTYGVNPDGTQWSAVFIGPLGANSPVWQKSTADLLGRTITTERPGFGGAALITSNFFNTAGHLVRTAEYSSLSASAPLRETLFEYDALGAQTLSAQDLNLNGVLDLDGPDRVSSNATEFVQINGDWYHEASSYTFPENNSATALLTGTQRQRLTGLGGATDHGILTAESISLDLLGNASLQQTHIDRDNAVRVGLVSTPDSTPDSTNASTTVSVNGLTQYTISKTGVLTTYTHDALGRLIHTVTACRDPQRQISSFTHYNALGQVDYVADALSNRTTFVYCPTTGRRIAVTDALTNTTHTAYDPEGRVIATWGATYPVAYEYDPYGRMTAMATTREPTNDFAALAAKLVAGASIASIGSTGSLDITQWLYDTATGLLTNKVYSDGKGPSYSYTPDGKLETRNWARGVTTTYSYTNTTGELIGITYSDATPSVSFTYDRLGRQKVAQTFLSAHHFAYDPATLALSTETVIDLQTGASNVITRTTDALGRSSGLSLGSDYATSYAYNPLGRFHSVSSSVFSVSSVANYSYLPGSDLIFGWSNGVVSVSRAFEPHRDLITAVENRAGEAVVSRFEYTNDELARRTRRVDNESVTNNFAYNPRSELTAAAMCTNSYGYAYDPIGNRLAATNNDEVLTYLANALNQYTNIADGVTLKPVYDLDGNMVSYGGSTFVWDGENRLIQVSNFQYHVSFAYDYLSRRFQKVVGSSTNTFLYDGWAMIQETTGTQTNSYVYGLDLSGSMQGAGTIGGILTADLNGTTVFYYYDANGNVTDLVDTNGTSVAHYEYGPFGQITVKTGTLADDNPFRFSTKYLDDDVDLYYYGYRYYNPELGRWVNRDPIGEEAFFQQIAKSISEDDLNRLAIRSNMPAYLFVENNPIIEYDLLGLNNPGCDLPDGLNPGTGTGADRDAYLRCCAQHDAAYYRHGCTAASWGHNIGGIAADIAGCKFCSILVNRLSPCARANSDVVACFARVCSGIGSPPTGDRWFCPNGPYRGRFYDNWVDIPASCWENGQRPVSP